MNKVKLEVEDQQEDIPKKSDAIQTKLTDISNDLTGLTGSVKGQLQVLP